MSKIAIVEQSWEVLVRHEIVLPDNTDLDDLGEVQDYVDDWLKEASYDDGDIRGSDRLYDSEIISLEEFEGN